MKNFCASLSRIHLYLLITACLTQLIFAQTNDDFVYYKNIVYHANSTLCTHTVPNASFTAYLNRDQSKVLFETAPRWKIGGDPNIAGNGAFGIELGNFANPLVAAGDSVFVRFTCLATGQQGVLSDSIPSIPWFHFPQILHLNPTSYPPRPQNLSLSFDHNGHRRITWTAEPGVVYSVYRRSVADTLSTGYARMLYTRIAQNLSSGSHTDTTAFNSGLGYVVVPRSGNTRGPHSPEVNDLPEPPQNAKLTLYRLNPLQVKVAWQPPSGAVNFRYRVYRSDTPGVPINGNHLLGETGARFFIDSQVNPEQIYYYRVVTVNGVGLMSDPSEEVHLRTMKPNVPAGFQIELFITDGIDHPGGITFGPQGRMFAAEVNSGEIKLIEDVDQDGFGDSVSVFADGFTQPVGLAWKGDSLYVSHRGEITIVRDTDGDDVADWSNTIISGWPTFWHQNNQLIFDDQGYFFVALGSWEDRTTGPSPYNNTIMRISPDGSNIQIWAEGIRNVYDMAFSPQGYLFGGDNGWQEQTPGGQPEELNYYAQGRDYGYPDYLGQPPPNTGTIGPLVEFPDHTAPTGVMFYRGDQFPAEYRNDLYMAFYGPDFFDPAIYHKAYRIVRCEVTDTVVTDTSQFATHFFRPMDMLEDSAGTLYVADLGQIFEPFVDGHIFKITYSGSTAIAAPSVKPAKFELQPNFPNPFNSETVIRYRLSKSGKVRLDIFNLLGQRITILVDGFQIAGQHQVIWNGLDNAGDEVPSGIYFYRLRFDNTQSKTKQMLLMK